MSARALLALSLLAVLVSAGVANLAQQSAEGQVANTSTAANDPMSFALVFSRASYGGPETSYNTLAVENADLNMLLSLNVRCIRIDIGYAPWLRGDQTAINEMTSLVQAIRAAGKCLIIADAASETYRGTGKIPWSEFMTAWVSRVSTLAALYQPDYYVVVKEPGWYVPMVSDATTNPQFQNVGVWLSLTQNLTNAVHSASPSTVVGVAIAANSLTQAQGAFYSEYLNRAQAISGISFVGFDVYSQNDQKATQTYLSQNPPSKTVWIPEAWSTPNGSALNGSPSQDAEWMLSMYKFASSINAAFLIPFYTDNFASYTLVADHPTDSAQIISLYDQRTPISSALQSLTAAATTSSTTTSTSSTPPSTSATQSAAGTNSTTTSHPATKIGSSGGSSSSASVSGSGSTATGTGRNSASNLRAVILGAVVLIVVVGAVLYLMLRRKR